MKCLMCQKEISKSNKSGYCAKCLVQHRREEKIQHWLESGDTGFTVDTTIRGVIRDYILNSQNKQCAICGMINVWNDRKLILYLTTLMAMQVIHHEKTYV